MKFIPPPDSIFCNWGGQPPATNNPWHASRSPDCRRRTCSGLFRHWPNNVVARGPVMVWITAVCGMCLFYSDWSLRHMAAIDSFPDSQQTPGTGCHSAPLTVSIRSGQECKESCQGGLSGQLVIIWIIWSAPSELEADHTPIIPRPHILLCDTINPSSIKKVHKD